MAVAIYEGKKATREIWSFIRKNNLINELKEHAGKTTRQVRRPELIAFLEYLESK